VLLDCSREGGRLTSAPGAEEMEVFGLHGGRRSTVPCHCGGGIRRALRVAFPSSLGLRVAFPSSLGPSGTGDNSQAHLGAELEHPRSGPRSRGAAQRRKNSRSGTESPGGSASARRWQWQPLSQGRRTHPLSPATRPRKAKMPQTPTLNGRAGTDRALSVSCRVRTSATEHRT